MTHDYNNGQIWGWNGGECPVHPETVVNTWHRKGLPQNESADQFWWDHRSNDDDIIAFKVVKPYVEPKVIWVNEHNSLLWVAHQSEQSARDDAVSSATRIAVKYVEARDD